MRVFIDRKYLLTSIALRLHLAASLNKSYTCYGTTRDNSKLMDRWRLQLFSGFRLREPGGSEVTTKSRRLIDLLMLLALKNDCSYSRHALAKQVFWDVDEGQDARMTVLLSRASQKLNSFGKSFLGITGDTVWLNQSAIEIDLVQAVRLIEQISSEASEGRPTRRLFEALGNMVSPLELSPGNPFVTEGVNTQRNRIRFLIHSKLVPATGIQGAASVGSLVEVLGLEEPLSATCCSQLMLLYAGIGDTSAVHRVFSRHEDALDDEFGEVVSRKVHDIYKLALSTEPFEGRARLLFSVPPSPVKSFGFEPLIEKLATLVRSARKGDRIELVGGPGSGKTHALSLLFACLTPSNNVAFIDLDQIDQELEQYDDISKSTVLLFDNFAPRHQSIVSSIVAATSATVSIAATECPSELPGSIWHPMPQLEIGHSLEYGSATQLILSELGSQDLPDNPSSVIRLSNELVTLTGGNPGALMKALDIVRTVGFKAAIEFIHSDLLSFGPVSLDRGERSFRRIVLQRVEALSPTQLRSCQILARLRHPISVGALLASHLHGPEVVRDLQAFGLAEPMPQHSVRLVEPVRLVLDSSPLGICLPEEWEQFCDSIYHWISRHADDVSKNLELSFSMGALEVVCGSLLDRGNCLDGLLMFEAISKWFPSSYFAFELVLQAEARLLSIDEIDSEKWGAFVVALGKGFFHKGQYKRMLRLCKWATNFASYELLGSEGKYRLLNLFGLAYRCLDEFSEAEQCYLQALLVAPSSEAKVTLNFNLGCLAEGQGNKLQALKYFESAAREYSPRADRRLMTKNTLDLLRIRSELFPDEAKTESSLLALFKESHLNDDMQAQAILISEIGEFKLRKGHAVDAGHYLIIGVFLCFQLGLTRETARLCKPSLQVLVTYLRHEEALEFADQIEILTLAISMDSNRDWGLPENLHAVLNEVLMQALHHLVSTGIELPGELQSLFVECDRIHSLYQGGIPTASIIESLSLKLSSSLSGEDLEGEIGVHSEMHGSNSGLKKISD
jgi:tetratricopeptide (TPR) repeat protein/DNA-binding SARP family transcriptional activator